MTEEITQMCWSPEEITDMRLEEEARELAELLDEQRKEADEVQDN